MASVTKPFVVQTLDEQERDEIAPGSPDGRRSLPIRGPMGIKAFGVNAYRAEPNVEVIRGHTETGVGGSDQEELYLVVDGRATFEIDGETVEAPQGSLVYVQPDARRRAVAGDAGATVLVVGGTPGKAYDVPPPENDEAFTAYNSGDYETAIAKQRIVLEKRPDNVITEFNMACYLARAGDADEAFEHLRRAVELDERIRELISTDEDLASLRDDPRFEDL
jgi:tetratricopeptide (TPR) repeat protein